MKTFLLFIAVVIAAALIWVRIAPINRDNWHVDPGDDETASTRGVRLIGREAPRYPADTDTVLDTFTGIALDEPHTRLIDGSIEEGRLTFVVRSKFLGLVDFVTVKAVSEGRETKLSIASRPRSPIGSDWGVNRARIDRWLQDMQHALGG